MIENRKKSSTYNGEIVAGSLLVPESRKIATLLLQGASEEDWRQAIIHHNILQKRSPASAKRQARLIRKRLSLMTPEHWILVKDGNAEVATWALLAAAVKHSRLLGDFMGNVCRQHWLTYNRSFSNMDWREFMETCSQVDPVVGEWTATTTSKLRQVVYRILAEAGYVDSTRKLNLQPVSIVPEVREYLTNHSEGYILQCMECTK
ncbi:MAG: DUF1819 family protein [Thermodesulfobacteriota bacterium]|nr:DUF1819 family protein [Thermodesulfobacteriota bacterium]